MIAHQSIRQQILAIVPKTCPACGAPTRLSDDLMHLECTSSSCTGKLYRRIEIMAKAFNIDNIGVKVAQELVEYLNLTAEHQLFELTTEDFLKVPRYQEGMASKLYDSIHVVDVNPVSWANFIRGVQIFRVGEGTAKEMARKYKSLDELLATTPLEMARRMDNMTTNLTEQIVKSIHDKEEEIRTIYSKVTVVFDDTSATTSENEILAVVTGKLGFGSRPEFQKTFGEQYGIKWGTAVSSNTDILVTNEASTSTKYKTAQKLQQQGGKIKIMTEEEFLAYIGANASTAENRMTETHKQVQQLDMFGGGFAEL